MVTGRQLIEAVPILAGSVNPKVYYTDKDLQRLFKITPRGLAYVVCFYNLADTGKTLGAVGLTCFLVWECGYDSQKIIGNITLRLPGYRKVSNEVLRDELSKMVEDDRNGYIYIVDEIDRVLPARYFNDKEQVETVLDWNQATKSRNWILGIQHVTTGPDKLVRDAYQMVIIPNWDSQSDILTMTCYSNPDMQEVIREIPNASDLFPLYDRYEPIKRMVVRHAPTGRAHH